MEEQIAEAETEDCPCLMDETGTEISRFCKKHGGAQ